MPGHAAWGIILNLTHSFKFSLSSIGVCQDARDLGSDMYAGACSYQGSPQGSELGSGTRRLGEQLQLQVELTPPERMGARKLGLFVLGLPAELYPLAVPGTAPSTCLHSSLAGFPSGWGVRYLPASAGDVGSIPSERCPGEGNGNPLPYSSWEIPWAEEPGGLQSRGSQRDGHDFMTKQFFSLSIRP